MPQLFEIVVGTYEEYLLGYKVKNNANSYELEKSFATHSHLASIRSVSSAKHFLSSAGADDSINLYDMRYRTESGKLAHHTDTVNCIAFTPDASHLLSCSNDGTIAAVRCGNWQLEKHWNKPHKGLAVNTLAVHPSGKIAISVGADGVLRTWNLIKGRQAYATNLVPRLKLDAKNINVLKWSPTGEKYLLAVGHRIDLYSIQSAGIACEIILDSKVTCVEFLNEDLVAIGLENGRIKLYDAKARTETLSTVVHDVRVKCIAHKDDLLITASSSGEIKLSRYTKNTFDILRSTSCGARITCLSLVSLNNIRSRVEEDRAFKKTEQNRGKRENKRQLRQVTIEYEDKWETVDSSDRSAQSTVATMGKDLSTPGAEYLSVNGGNKGKRRNTEDSQASTEEYKSKKQKKKRKDKKASITTGGGCVDFNVRQREKDSEKQNREIIECQETKSRKFLKSDAAHASIESKNSRGSSKSTWIVEDKNVRRQKRVERDHQRGTIGIILQPDTV